MGKRRFERMAASCGSQRQRAGPTAMPGMAILHTLLEHIYDSRRKERGRLFQAHSRYIEVTTTPQVRPVTERNATRAIG